MGGSVRRFSGLLVSAATLLASACATVDPPPDNLPGETIVYTPSYGPFCFGCVFTTITVAEDGRVWVERERQVGSPEDILSDRKAVWRVRREMVSVTPDQLAAFRALLAPYRPQGRTAFYGDACEIFFTDMPGTYVWWRRADAEDMLSYNFGCDPDMHARMKADLVAAPALLGIAMPEQSWAATTRMH